MGPLHLHVPLVRVYAFVQAAQRWVSLYEIATGAQVPAPQAERVIGHLLKRRIVARAEIVPESYRYRLAPAQTRHQSLYHARLVQAHTPPAKRH